MQELIAIIFVVGMTFAIPPPNEAYSDCQLAQEREQCFQILYDAMSAPQPSGLKESFQYYCRKIPDFVPCLEENEADYEAMSHCPGNGLFIKVMSSKLDHVVTWSQMFSAAMDFIETANDLVCTRTDEVVNLVTCAMENDKDLLSNFRYCNNEYLDPWVRSTEDVDAADICRSIYGFTTCLKDSLITVCGPQYSNLLDKAYYDGIEDVIGGALGCSESTPPQPLLKFARSLRSRFRK